MECFYIKLKSKGNKMKIYNFIDHCFCQTSTKNHHKNVKCVKIYDNYLILMKNSPTSAMNTFKENGEFPGKLFCKLFLC